jgi:hypothetical protein
MTMEVSFVTQKPSVVSKWHKTELPKMFIEYQHYKISNYPSHHNIKI